MLHKSGLKLFLAILLFGFSAVGAKAANATVTIADDPAGTGNCAAGASCSLRQAIAAVGSGDAIFFNLPAADCPNGVCTINLQSGITIDKSLIIFGTGTRSLIIKPGTPNLGAITILTVAAPFGTSTPINVTITGLTVSGGYLSAPNLYTGAGGIVVGNGTTTVLLNYVSVTNNGGGAAGGIYNQACNLTIINSLIANNTGRQTGGIHNLGTLRVSNSTISGNAATMAETNPNTVSAGGILNTFQLMAGAGNLTLTNSTIANNSSPSQLAFSAGGLVRTNLNETNADIRNSIIAGNSCGSDNNDVQGTFLSRGNNLIGSTTGSSGFGFGGSNDIVNQSANLAPLADNGGQSLTHALLAGSPAINAGNDCAINVSCTGSNPPYNMEFDQRAQPFARKAGAAIDIGAYELQNRKTPFDFDGDGKSDVAVARNVGGNLAWYLLGSQTGFTGANFGVAADRIVPADYDGDGKTDIAVVRTNLNNTLSWYLLQSQAGFTGQTFGIAGDTPVPADYDGDGRADVAVARARAAR